MELKIEDVQAQIDDILNFLEKRRAASAYAARNARSDRAAGKAEAYQDAIDLIKNIKTNQS
jgi:hypothetical protein